MEIYLRVARLAFSALLGAACGALVPIVALVLLEPAEYGSFSTIYLLFAYGVSLQYSIVSEAWARVRGVYRKRTAWAGYSTALFSLAATIGALAVFVSLLFPELREMTGWLATAVLFGVYRSGARYYRLALGRTGRVFLSDFLGIASFLGIFVLLRDSEPLLVLVTSWSLSTFASAVGLGLPSLRRGAGPVRWWRAHKREIIPLLTDSTLMDVGAIGAPLLLVGAMGPANFGLYRGIANTAMPVRLVLDPLRPVLGRKPQALFFRKTVLWLIGITTLLIATGCYCALEFLVPQLPIRLGTLSELSVFALPAAIFAAASFIGTLYYIVCRTSTGRKTIMMGRICQTLVVVAMPVLGFVTMGLVGAIWGFVISASVSAVIWMILAVPRSQVAGAAALEQSGLPSRASTTRKRSFRQQSPDQPCTRSSDT